MVAVFVVCVFRIRSCKLSEVGMNFCHLCRKLGSPSKNMMSDFALEVAKYSKIILPQRQFQYCFAPLAIQSIPLCLHTLLKYLKSKVSPQVRVCNQILVC